MAEHRTASQHWWDPYVKTAWSVITTAASRAQALAKIEDQLEWLTGLLAGDEDSGLAIRYKKKPQVGDWLYVETTDNTTDADPWLSQGIVFRATGAGAGGITLQDEGSGGVNLRTTNHGPIDLIDELGGGIYVETKEHGGMIFRSRGGGGIYFEEYDGGGIGLSSDSNGGLFLEATGAGSGQGVQISSDNINSDGVGVSVNLGRTGVGLGVYDHLFNVLFKVRDIAASLGSYAVEFVAPGFHVSSAGADISHEVSGGGGYYVNVASESQLVLDNAGLIEISSLDAAGVVHIATAGGPEVFLDSSTKKLRVDLPSAGSVEVRDSAGNPIFRVDEDGTPHIKTGKTWQADL